MINLEPICARYGHRMIEEENSISLSDQENTITKALGVLVENGLYAMGIYLLSCSKKEYGKKILTTHLAELWKEPGLNLLPANTSATPAAVLTGVQTITEKLPSLILARKVTEQALTFARYHAKAGVPAPSPGRQEAE